MTSFRDKTESLTKCSDDIKLLLREGYDIKLACLQHDVSRLKNLVDNALEGNTFKIVIADGSYDSKENFRYLYDNNIEAAIKV